MSDDTRFRATLPTVPSWPTRARSCCSSRISGGRRGKPAPHIHGAAREPYAAAARAPGPLHRGLGGGPRKASPSHQAGRCRDPREYAFLRRRGEERSRSSWVRGARRLTMSTTPSPTAHRAHASTEGLAHRLPAYAGRAMEAELNALEKALGNPERPVAAVVGGAKVSTKLEVLAPSRREGRSSDHRRRHGEHLPRCARGECRQEPLRARSDRQAE